MQTGRTVPQFAARSSRVSSCHAAAPLSAARHQDTLPYEAPGSAHDPLSDFQHPISIEQFRQLGYDAVDMVCQYMAGVLPHARVVPNIQPGYLRPLLPYTAPEKPEPWTQIKRDFWDIIMTGVTHWQSPNNFSWFPANTSMPGILAELLAGALNMVGFNWESGPVNTELEMVMLDWLAKLCGLPDKFLWRLPSSSSSSSRAGSQPDTVGNCYGTNESFIGASRTFAGSDTSSSSNSSSSSSKATGVIIHGSSGSSKAPDDMIQGSSSSISPGGIIVGSSSSSSSSKSPGGMIQGSSSEAVLVAMLAARARALVGQPPEAALKLVAYGSNQAHSCFLKATMVLGLQHVRLLQANSSTQFAVTPQQLADAVAADLQHGLIPFCYLATIGTTSSCAVDPISELAGVCQKYNIWMHVDAAWAGTAAIVSEQRRWFEGLDKVNSYSFNPYKWMLTPMGVCACWFEDSTFLREALSLTPTYLRGRGNMPDFKDWETPLGRRFRSLYLWFVLRMYGSEKLQALFRHHIALGEWLADQVKADNRFELVVPPRFGLVCLRLNGVGNDGNRALLAAINNAGLSPLVGTDLDGLFTVRVAIGQAYTQLEHVQRVWALIQEQADKMLAQHHAADVQ